MHNLHDVVVGGVHTREYIMLIYAEGAERRATDCLITASVNSEVLEVPPMSRVRTCPCESDSVRINGS